MYYTKNQVEHIIDLIQTNGKDNVAVSRLDQTNEYCICINSINASEELEVKEFSSYFISLDFDKDVYSLRHYKIPKNTLKELCENYEMIQNSSIKTLASTEGICFNYGFLVSKEDRNSFVDFINSSKHFFITKDLAAYIKSIENCNHEIIKDFVYNINNSSKLLIRNTTDVEELFNDSSDQNWHIDIVTADTKQLLAQIERTPKSYRILMDFDEGLEPNIKCPVTTKGNLISAVNYINDTLSAFPQYRPYIDELVNAVP